MNIYLIRHGTTLNNLESRHQHPESPLAEEGAELIRTLAQNVVDIDAQVIYTSPLIRAFKTAEIINDVLNLPLITDELLKEIKRPTVFEGQLHGEANVKEIKKLIRENYHLKDWHHSDEENFFDLKNRIIRFMEKMESQNYERIIAVSHGIVIKMFTALVIFGKELDGQTFLKFYDGTSISNGGITICRFENNKWKLRSMNVSKNIKVI